MKTTDDIIRMAREAGVPDSWDLNWFDPYYERFAALVASAEREKNASLVEQMGMEGYGTLAIAAAIRGQS